MGTYLTNGIVQDIVIEKKQAEGQGVAIGEINRQLEKEVDIKRYNFNEDADAYYWKIKPEMFSSNLVEFLDTQFQMYCGGKNRHMQDTIEALIKTKTAEEIIGLAEGKSLVHFQLLDYIMEYIKVLRVNGFNTDIAVHYRLISYFLNGKIIMECYGNILRYFEHTIRLQRAKYPIVDCVKVLITN